VKCETKYEPCLGDLLVLVLVHDELGGLARRVNDERIAVEAVQHNGILSAQVISWQTVRLPAQAVVGIRQILYTATSYSVDKYCYTAASQWTNNVTQQPASGQILLKSVNLTCRSAIEVIYLSG